MDPWGEDDARAPRSFGWGCAIATIIGSVAAVIALVVVIRLAASLAPDIPR